MDVVPSQTFRRPSVPNIIIDMALDDFGLDTETYVRSDKYVLQSVTNHMINIADSMSKDQMTVSQSILLDNKLTPQHYDRDLHDNTTKQDKRKVVSFSKHVDITHVDNINDINPETWKEDIYTYDVSECIIMQNRKKSNEAKKWNKWAREYQTYIDNKLCIKSKK